VGVDTTHHDSQSLVKGIDALDENLSNVIIGWEAEFGRGWPAARGSTRLLQNQV
jgi:hypothetical protein